MYNIYIIYINIHNIYIIHFGVVMSLVYGISAHFEFNIYEDF